MHCLLENYLVEVSEQLSPLPLVRRNEELRELQQHLLNATVVNQESGQSEDEAAINVMEQFGPPQDLGESLIWAWRRGKRLAKRSFWKATACASVLTLLMPNLLTPLVYPYFQQASQKHLYPGWTLVAGFVFMMGVPLLVGGVSGYAFPKRAVSGALAATTIHLLWIAQYIYAVHERHTPVDITNACSYIIGTLIKALLMVLAMWVTSRGRNRRVQPIHV